MKAKAATSRRTPDGPRPSFDCKPRIAGVTRLKLITPSKGFGYADLEKKIPADPQTVYRIGSVTKSFTALMLMQLRDAGKLALVPVRTSNNYFARLGSGGPPIEVSDVTGSIVLNRT